MSHPHRLRPYLHRTSANSAVGVAVHSPTRADAQAPDRLQVEPAVAVEEFTDSFGNRCTDWSPLRASCASSTILSSPIRANPIRSVPRRCSTPSRRCRRRFCLFCWPAATARWTACRKSPGNCSARRRRAGHGCRRCATGFTANVEFGYAFARPTKTAYDVYEEHNGVCRDFTHLAITLCRCLNIPARYATGYLGDIGVPVSPSPMDFSAWFEVYLGGTWYTFDARHNHAAHRPRVDGPRPRCGGRRPDDVVRADDAGTVQGLDGRGGSMSTESTNSHPTQPPPRSGEGEPTQNPTPRPPPRSGEGEKEGRRLLSGSPSPFRGGGGGEGLSNGIEPRTGLFEGYSLGSAYDEMFDAGLRPRPHYQRLCSRLRT